ncbi:MAG: hypothetical protein RLY35_640 [Bacteroidota bacterium]
MASGKTTYGRQLAEEKGYPFYDTDALIEEKIGMSVAEFFAQWGEKYFRRMERDVLYGLLSRQESFVCATGGGSVCQPDIMDWLNRAGDTVWLDTPWEVIEKRLTGDTTRPLATSMSDEELKMLYDLRCGYYGKAGRKKVMR